MTHGTLHPCLSRTAGVSGSKIAGYPGAEQPRVVGMCPKGYREARGLAIWGATEAPVWRLDKLSYLKGQLSF